MTPEKQIQWGSYNCNCENCQYTRKFKGYMPCLNKRPLGKPPKQE